MSRMTCRNGLIIVAAMCLGLMVTSVRGGSLDSPASPTDPASAMYTAKDLYDRLASGTNAPKRAGAFTEPTAGPTAGTMPTTDDIMAKAPATNASGAVAGEVLFGKTFWGLTQGAWGTRTGSAYPALVPKTGQTNSYQAGDDGNYQKGVAWPNPRFTVGTSGDATNCVTDNLTGLMWAWNANMGGVVTWSNAIVYCEGLTYGGQTDWRLPNRRELFSLIVDDGWYSPALCNTAGTGQWVENDPFTGVQTAYYWSSSTIADDAATAWRVYLSVGGMYFGDKASSNYVWPVRGGQ